jgi:predicted DsbA family dithiol-disulfide isomerase
MSSPELTIDVYSDVICPWCYIGKRRLERALNHTHETQARVVWRPFQLNPTMPQAGMDRTRYLEAKFGTLEAFRPMEEQMLAAGTAVKIPFALEKAVRTPNTFLAHRLIWYAEEQGRQDAVVESLFRGYFVEGEDIGDNRVLVRLAERAGLDARAADHFLAGHDREAEVRTEEAAGHRLGIRGVPYFVLNKTHGLSGAQPVEVFVAAIHRMRGHIAATQSAPGGG